MGFQAKQAGRVIALSLLGLVFAPVGVFASDPQLERLNIGDLMSDEGGEGTNFVITPGSLIPEFASVTTPKISGVELFSNQAVFSFGDSSFLENTPVSALHVNGDELQFWQANTEITSNGALLIGASADEIAEHLQTVGLVHAQSSTNFNNLTSPDATVAKSLNTQLPALSASLSGGSGTNSNATSVASSISLNSAASPSEMIELANPVLSRDASPIGGGSLSGSSLPEPASTAILGLSAMGLLLRRRNAR